MFIYTNVHPRPYVKWRCNAMGDQLLINVSNFRCKTAVVYSIRYTSWTLSLHWAIVGGRGFNQDAVITLFAIRNNVLNNFVWLSSGEFSGTMPSIKCIGSIGRSIDKHCFISFCMFFQYSDNFGQSQNICVWSPGKPQPLQHSGGVLLHFDVANGVLKYLTLNFQPYSLQLGLCVTLWPCSNEVSHCSSEIIVFISISHFSLISKLFSPRSSCIALYKYDIIFFVTVPWMNKRKRCSILDGREQSFSHSLWLLGLLDQVPGLDTRGSLWVIQDRVLME